MDMMLLTEDDLGSSFDESPEDEDSPGYFEAGCLADALSFGDRAASTAAVHFDSAEGDGVRAVSNRLLAYPSQDEADAALRQMRDRLSSCSSVYTDSDDAVVSFRVQPAMTGATAPRADDEVATTARGTVSSHGVELDAALSISVLRVKDHLSIIEIMDLDREPAGGYEVAALTNRAIEHMQHVLDDRR